MPLYKVRKSPFFWYDIRIGSKRCRGSTKETNISRARQVESALINKYSAGEIPRRHTPTLAEFSVEFLRFNSETRRDEDTKAYYRNGWRMLSQCPLAKVKVDRITKSSADSVRPAGSGSNVNCAIRTLRRMLSLAQEKGLIASAPRFELATEVQRDRIFTPQQEEAYIAGANPTVRDTFIMGMDTGTRPSEAVSLRAEDVDFMTRTFLIVTGKTKKSRRRLDMTSRVYDLLIERVRLGSEWVFPAPRGTGHIKAKSVSVMGSALKRKIGLPADVVLYSSRHTFATDYQAATKDLVKTSRKLGHGSTTITERYVHVQASDDALMMDARNQARRDSHTFGHTALPVQ